MIKERVKGPAGILPGKEGSIYLAPEPDLQADEEEVYRSFRRIPLGSSAPTLKA